MTRAWFPSIAYAYLCSPAASRAAWALAAVLAFAAIYALDINRNVFYLMFACSVAVVATALVDRAVIRAIIVAVLAASSVVTVAKPLLPIVDTQAGTESNSRRLANGEVLRFRFLLTDIQKRREECGDLEESAVAAGINLAAAEFRINGETVPTKLTKIFNYDLAWGSLPADARDAVDVTLTAGENVLLVQGPEVSGKTEYRNAVFIELQNNKCRVFYHAQAIPTGATSANGK